MLQRDMKPIVLIGADVVPDGTRDSAFGYLTYVESLKRAGAIPLIVPPQPENVEALLGQIDGVVLAGGFDCDPAEYGEEPHPTVEPMDVRRQSNDLTLARLAHERGVPTFGICLGLQVMNVAAGGTLIQDIPSQHEGSIEHSSEPDDRLRHDIDIHDGTRLAEILGAGRRNVNSSHHQAVREPGQSLRVTALATDGVIEGLEDPNHPFFLGVQWHPEDMAGEESATRLFAAFVQAARQHAERRRAFVTGDAATTE